ncbi:MULTISPECIES: helix-turn-helix domain-containing protein [Dictyoglomus]|jgi:transcriptional regulator with XRE-family HTH domain|uniref:Transcriptional regulator, XRE family n=1 Tax=Dictyoglomus turgidum (strain DSM 6724 / Z-1310) TaxID=515635 RepID=B8E102_DICTD|nr:MULTISPECIES: helix-turn-helix domain-containing protein [Dictyoglomus]ACK42739.1 transcriptional regulator, XRE family [Dictyoglomus turgidum DSM 6724]HBU30798.1 DUF4115 domain-containing protein [Dictyoglomus sp.]
MVEESKTLGEILREEREKRGLSLREVSDSLKISYRYLKALEDDEYDKVNLAEIYKKGILKKYVKFLGLFEDEIFKIYTAQYKTKIEESLPKLAKSERCSWKYGVYLIVIFIIFLTLFLTAKFNQRETPKNVRTDIRNYELTMTETYTESNSEVNFTHTFTDTIKVVAVDRVWLRVSYNNNTIYEGTLKEGDTLTWTYTPLYFHIGNAGGLEIYYNDNSLGVLGKKGEVIKIKVP